MQPILALNPKIPKDCEGRIQSLSNVTEDMKRLWVHLARRPVFQRSLLEEKKYCLNLVMTSFSMKAVWFSSCNFLAHSTTWHFVYREMTPALFGSFGSSSSSCSGSWGNASSSRWGLSALLFFVALPASSSPFLVLLFFVGLSGVTKSSSCSATLFRDPKGRPARFCFPRCRSSATDLSRDFFASARFLPNNPQSGWSGKLPPTKPKSSKIASNSRFLTTLSFRRLTNATLAWLGSVASNGNTNCMHWSDTSLRSSKDFSILEIFSALEFGVGVELSTSISLLWMLWERCSRSCFRCSTLFNAALRNASSGLNRKCNGAGQEIISSI